jgi:O-antigen ligase
LSAIAITAERPHAGNGEVTTPPDRGTGVEPSGGEPGAQSTLWWPTLLIATVLSLIAFVAGGGLNLSSMTKLEMALTIGSGGIVVTATLLSPAGRRSYGLWPVGLLLAFTALTALSSVWSVQPDASFKDAGRMLAYSGVFGAAVVLARVAPARWAALLGGLTLAAVVVSVYALLTKVFPHQLDANDVYARLRAPYSYWNAIGLTAAMGAIGCMWLGSRRTGHALLTALAYPAMALMLVTLMLAYSRGALLALALGLALWFCIVPLRLRGAAVLIAGGIGAAVVVVWDFSTHALSAEAIALGERVTAGRQLGVLLAAMVLALLLLGIAVGFWTARRPPSARTRRRTGAVLLTIPVIAVIALLGALTVSHRGLTGSISHSLNSITNTNARVPNTPGRLTAVSSVRAQYWKQALEVFEADPPLGVGAEGYATARLRYSSQTLDVRHAHGFVVQTLADLGLVGLTLALLLLAAWMAAAGRATHPFNRRWTGWRALLNRDGVERRGWRRWTIGGHAAPYSPERIGMLSMLVLVVVFGLHSLIDWTWYIPGNACVALLCAGWLAGRGPLLDRNGSPMPGNASAGRFTSAQGTPGVQSESRLRLPGPPELRPLRLIVAGAVLLGTVLAAWAQWQPLRAEDTSQRALALLAGNPSGARTEAQAAVDEDPLSARALIYLAKIEQANGQASLAQSTFQRAVRLQPSNPETWLALGEFDVTSEPRTAVEELAAAIYLNPESIAPELIARGNEEAITIQNDYVQALRASVPLEARTPSSG